MCLGRGNEYPRSDRIDVALWGWITFYFGVLDVLQAIRFREISAIDSPLAAAHKAIYEMANAYFIYWG